MIASTKKYLTVPREKCFFYSGPISCFAGLLLKYSGASNLQPRAEKIRPPKVCKSNVFLLMSGDWLEPPMKYTWGVSASVFCSSKQASSMGKKHS